MIKCHNGNVLFIILIAVALFAALTQAVISSFGTENSRNRSEDNMAFASDAILYGQSLATAVNVMLAKGESEQAVSFANGVTNVSYTNGNCSSDSCYVFRPGGGAVNYSHPPIEIFDSQYSAQTYYGEWAFTTIAITHIGSAPNLVASLHWLDEDVCLEINNILEIDNPNDDPPLVNEPAADLVFTAYTGSFSSTDPIASSDLHGQQAACIRNNDGHYIFYTVLLAR